MALTQTQRDLDLYAQEKMHNLIKDVVQTFQIAQQPGSAAIACIGVACLRVAATLAVHANMPPKRWVETCVDVWEQAIEANNANEEGK